MKILSIGEFDPCGVSLRHRAALKTIGVEYRFAVRRVWWREGMAADWIVGERACDMAALRAFAEAADVVQVCPVIGQPWASQPPLIYREDVGPDGEDWGFSWTKVKGARLALFHGSPLAEPHAERYADLYRGRGWRIAATTLDYVTRMDALYLPPVVSGLPPPSELRKPGDGLRIIHSPTDPRMCSTSEFKIAMQRIGFAEVPIEGSEDVATILNGIPHKRLLAIKAKHHVGYDHLRGGFSINSVENAALGLVNLVGVWPRCREWLASRMDVRLPWPEIATMDDVAAWAGRLAEDVDETRRLQKAAREWYERDWSPERLTSWIHRQYTEVLAS